jgi:carboxypeptidase Taq
LITNINQDYNKLLSKAKDLSVLQSAISIIQWDMETMMPPKAVELRSQQLALLSRVEHQISTDPEIGKLLEQIAANADFDSLGQVEKRNLHLIKKNYDEQTALPEKLVEETAKQQAIAVNVWKKAKKAQDFNLFKPDLQKLFDLTKQAAEILMKVKQTATSYDALLDLYEPRMTAAMITPIFNKLQSGLTTLLPKIMSAPQQPQQTQLRQEVPIEKQRQIAKALAEAVGYDVTSPNAGGRIDETEHPFTSGSYDDVRITTHYYPNDFASSIFSVLHESGHALYDQNRNQDWKYQPVGSHCSMGIHESQSRFMENIVGRSREFWTSFLPKLKKIAEPSLNSAELEPFVHSINAVKPSKIRIESDEVTYSLHIIIRFQIEQDLFANKVKVDELPAVWNQKYQEYLGLKIENDSEGVMQDTHWASGYFGYFPSYALGNIYSGQMLAKIEQDEPNWRNQLAQGNLEPARKWLIGNIQNPSNLFDPAELVKTATGKEIDAEPYLKYLNGKYNELYGF